MTRYSALLIAAASLATSVAKAGSPIAPNKQASRVKVPSVAQPLSFEATSDSGPVVATESAFNYARTWELIYKDTDGVSHAVRFGIPKVTPCPETTVGNLRGERPILVQLADSHWTAWGPIFAALNTPDVYVLADENSYTYISFNGSGDVSSPDVLNGTVISTTCPRSGGNCSSQRKAATMSAVGAAPEVDFHMVVMKAGGNPITQDGAVFTTGPYVSQNPIYGYYFAEQGLFEACEVNDNSGGNLNLSFWYGNDSSQLFRYHNEELNKNIDVEFTLSSSSRTSSQPFVFRWDGLSAAGDQSWVEFVGNP